MKRHLGWAIASVILVGGVGGALAADMPVKAPPPPPPPPSWSGFYLGADIGGGWRSSENVTWVDPNFLLGVAGAVPSPLTLPLSGDRFGITGGIYAGYNWQFAPSWVFGVEGDINAASFSQKTIIAPLFPGTSSAALATQLSAVANNEALASIRARLGFVGWNTLWYVTGGGAWTEGHNTGQGVFFNTYTDGASVHVSKTGWVAGGGAEFMIAPNVLLRAEYLYYKFDGGTTLAAPYVNGPTVPPFGVGNPPPTFTWNNYNIQVVRVGASYKFNWGY